MDQSDSRQQLQVERVARALERRVVLFAFIRGEISEGQFYAFNEAQS